MQRSHRRGLPERAVLAGAIGAASGCGVLFGVDFDDATLRTLDAAEDSSTVDSTSPAREALDGFWTDASHGPNQDASLESAANDAEAEGAVCMTDARECKDGRPRACDGAGWVEEGACPVSCSDGYCTGECVAGALGCSGRKPMHCDVHGHWEAQPMCGEPSRWCALGTCSPKPSLGTLAASEDHTCALTREGGVMCWGENDYGQLGDGTKNESNRLVQAYGLTQGMQGVFAGFSREVLSCALTSAGSAVCWGAVPFAYPSLVPVEIPGLGSSLTAISIAFTHACILSSQGGLRCWGLNDLGQLGDGSETSRFDHPVDVVGLSSGVVGVSTGPQHSCAATESGRILCWGDNKAGQLGVGPQTDRSSLPVNVCEGRTVVAGGLHTCAITSSGGVKCWGRNDHGQIGANEQTFKVSEPVDVVGLSVGVEQVCAGTSHSCALSVDGAVLCWGASPAAGSTAPAEVPGLGEGVVAISCGGDHSCAAMANGTLRCWGANRNGQLGDGTKIDSVAPVEVVGF